MNEIEIVKRYDLENLSPKLNNVQKEVIIARNSQTLKKLQATEKPLFVAQLIKAFDLAIDLTGQNKDKESHQKQGIACADALGRDFRVGEFGSLTSEELMIAIQRGCKKVYGDFFGINYTTITQFIKGYLQEQNEAITKQRIYENDLKWKKDQKEKAKAARLEYDSSFEGWVESDRAAKKKDPTVMIDDLGSQKYLQLSKEKRLNLSEQEIEKLKERTLIVFDREVSEARKLVVQKRASTSGDKIKPVFRLPNDESERAAKNRIFAKLAYNEFLKG